MPESTLDPTSQQLSALSADRSEATIVMVNLLRFKHRADGVLADESVSGEEAYRRYGEAVASSLARVGGSLEFVGQGKQTVIGPDGERWDLIALVRYPSRKAFIEMVGDPEFLQKHELRNAALADSRLICSEPLDFG